MLRSNSKSLGNHVVGHRKNVDKYEQLKLKMKHCPIFSREIFTSRLFYV